MKLYYLYHEYKTKENFISRKSIGFFVSEKETQEIIKKYQSLPGFENYKKHFFVQEIPLDNSSFFSYPPLKKNVNYIYTVYEIQEYKEYDYEISSLLGCFTTQDNARIFVESLDLQLSDEKFNSTIEIYKEKVGLVGWKHGFQTIESKNH